MTSKIITTDNQIELQLKKQRTRADDRRAAVAAGETRPAITRLDFRDKRSSLEIRIGAKDAVFVWPTRHPVTKKRLTVTIGKFSEMRLAEARQALAKVEQERTRRGRTPTNQKFCDVILAYLQVDEIDSPAAVNSEYLLDTRKKTRLRHPEKVVDSLRRHVYPAMCDIPARDLETHDVIDMIEATKRGSTGSEPARLALIYCNRVCKWALKMQKIKHNPCAGLEASDFAVAPKKTEPRVPSRDEVVGLYAVLQSASRMDVRVRCGIELLMLLACRTGELNKARWSEINWKQTRWVVPADHNKSGREMIYPLPSRAVELLRTLNESTRDTGLIMGGIDRNSLWQAFTRLQEQTPAQVRDGKPAAWEVDEGKARITVHNLRKLFSTQCRGLRLASREVVEDQLAHTWVNESSVEGIYDASELVPERRVLMDKWQWVLENPGKRLALESEYKMGDPDPTREKLEDSTDMAALRA